MAQKEGNEYLTNTYPLPGTELRQFYYTRRYQYLILKSEEIVAPLRILYLAIMIR